MQRRTDHRAVLSLAALWTLCVMLALTVGSLGCFECADYGEYCVELDCCDDLSCEYDQTAGYRCR